MHQKNILETTIAQDLRIMKHSIGSIYLPTYINIQIRVCSSVYVSIYINDFKNELQMHYCMP